MERKKLRLNRKRDYVLAEVLLLCIIWDILYIKIYVDEHQQAGDFYAYKRLRPYRYYNSGYR